MDDTPAPPLTPPAPLHWGAEALWQQLEPLLPGLSVEVVARTTSTNTQLLERARVAREPEGDSAFVQVRRSIESGAFGRRAADIQPCLLVAEHQTAGRGRLGRTWKSLPGASLTFSLALPMRMADWSGLSLAVGVALADALEPDALPGAARIGLKWPNDLWLMDAPGIGVKLGGILIETVAAGSQRLAVIGIGLNVLPLEQPEGTSEFGCLQAFEPQATAPVLLERVALPLVRALKQFEREGFGAFAERYAARDLLRGQPVRTTLPEVPEGVAQGVTNDGALRVQTGAGLKHITSGEVSVRLNPPAAPC
jgi:BirA family transcriptional regulator, biotin operon repressor / biotin---[acetyl-CoA-carboxylase] ligase